MSLEDHFVKMVDMGSCNALYGGFVATRRLMPHLHGKVEGILERFVQRKKVPRAIGSRMRIRWFAGIALLLCSTVSCGSEFFVFDSSGSPLLISRRGFTAKDCTDKVKHDAARMGVTLRYIHIRGSMVGRSLLWPIDPGYACEAAIGPVQGPSGSYPMDPHLLSRGF